MKIARIEVFPYGLPLKNFTDAYTSFTISNAVLVKIRGSQNFMERL